MLLVLCVLMAPNAWGAEPRLVHLDWQNGSALVGLHGVGHDAVNEARIAFDVGPCHRALRLDLLYEPASTGKPDGSDPRIPYVFHVTVRNATGDLVSQRSLSDPGYGYPMGTVPAAGSYEVMVRLDIGFLVDWQVRVRGFEAHDEPTCALFLNEVETSPSGETGQEWIEVYNSGTTDLALDGWQVWGEVWRAAVDPTPFTIPNNTSVPAEGHLRIYLQDAEAFSGENETVVLADPAGRPLDVSAPLTDLEEDSRSWSRVTDGGATWTFGRSTPGYANGT